MFIAAAAAAGAGVVAACSSTKKRARATGATPSSVPSAGPVPTAPSAAGATSVAPSPTAPATTVVHQGPAIYVASGRSSSTGVALTFHTAGDATVVESILDQAGRLGAKATFFVVGTWATANPAVVTRILAEGHELGNHTWSHIDLPALPPDQMFEEIQKCAAVLQRETGSISRWFRPSQTDVPDAAILEQAGRAGYATSVGYDIDPLDYTDPGAALVESRVRAQLHGGAIVSLHTLYAGTATAFTPIVAAIRAQGLEPVTTSAVLA